MKSGREILKDRLRYQGKQYSQGQMARGGGQSVHIMTMAVERIEELEKALNDLLNDCINFNGGTLTNCILEQASAALNDGVPNVKLTGCAY